MRRVVRSLFIIPLLTTVIASSLMSCGGDSEQPNVKTIKAANQGYSNDDLYRFFAVAFGAAPGVTYMGQLIEAAEWGLSIKEIVNIFTTKPQFTDTYPVSMSNVDFATRLVSNVVGNNADDLSKQEAINDIVSALSLPNWTRGDVIYAVFNNLANKPESDTKWYGTAKKMANQVVFAKYFTEVMKEDTLDLNSLRNVISPVDKSTATTGDLSAAISRFKDPLFSNVAVNLPDLYSKFLSMCNPQDVNIQTVVAANLAGHKNGKKDLLVGLWCQPTVGAVINVPTVNGVVALIQQSDGSFLDATKKLFGVDLLDAGGGVPIRSVAYDLNGDGYDEVFFAVTGEDGRILPSDFTGYNKKNFVLTSTGGGNYKYESIGWASYNYLAKLINGPNGIPDVMTATIGYGGKDQVFRLTNGQWQSINDYDNGPSFSGSFYSYANLTGITDSSMSPKNENSSIALYKKQTNGSWTEVSSVAIGTTQTGQHRSWNSQVGPLTILTVNGKDYGYVSFSDNCLVNNSAKNIKYSIFIAPANRIIGGYTAGRLLVEGDPKDMERELLILGYQDKGNTIEKVNVSFKNLKSDENFFTLNCTDLNGDGIDDMFISNWGVGQKPNIYLNSPDNTFSLVDPRLIPIQSASNNGSIALYEDMDGDGIKDLVYVPQNGIRQANSAKFQIFKGLRKLRIADTLN